jgi:hypothetical protein
MPESILFPGRWLTFDKEVISRQWGEVLQHVMLENGISIDFYDSDPFNLAVFRNLERPILVEHNISNIDAWIGKILLDRRFQTYLTTL